MRMPKYIQRAIWKTLSVFTALTLAVPGNVLLFAPQVARAETVLFTDGFESNDFLSWTSVDSPKWDTSGGDVCSESKRAQVKGDTEDDDILLKEQSTEGYEDIQLSYCYRIKESLEEGDHVYVEWSVDGEAWNTLADYTDLEEGDWVAVDHSLPNDAASDQPGFRFRFRAVLNAATTDEWHLDDVVLNGEAIPEEPGAIHVFKYFDIDGDGEYNNGDFPLEGWEICLWSDDWGDWWCEWTDGDGWIWWTDLEPGEYRVQEEDRAGWEHTTDSFFDVFVESDEVVGDDDDPLYFGNRLRGSVHALKFYDLDESGFWDWRDVNENDQWDWGEGEEMPLPGWEICLEPDGFDEGWMEDLWFELSDGDWEWCQQTDQSGWVWWFGLPPGWYWLEEEMSGDQEDQGWAPTWPEDGSGYWVWISEDGIVEYWDEDENEEFEIATFGNWADPGAVHASKWLWPFPVFDEGGFGGPPRIFFDEGGFFFDEGTLWFGEFGPLPLLVPPLEDWELCLSRGWWRDESMQWQELDCERTNEQGWVWWMNLPPGDYQVTEEDRPGWLHVTDPVWELFLGAGEVIENIFFVNDDNEPPVSEFDNASGGLDHEDQEGLHHKIIDTEIVSLELQGTSTDNVAIDPEQGNVELTVWQVGNAGSVENFPAQSFFDVFYELNCDTVVRREAPPMQPLEIPIEIIALQLSSVEPISVNTVRWNYTFPLGDTGSGVYCFEAVATDNAGNTEHTAFAGPVAYIPVPQISAEQAVTQPISTTSAIISWTTDHPATSRVIYDTVAHVVLGEEPNYGYAFSTPEDPALVLDHLVTLYNLISGTEYFYRTVSHGSPENVGDEGTFTTNPAPQPLVGGTGPIIVAQQRPSEDEAQLGFEGPPSAHEEESAPPEEESAPPRPTLPEAISEQLPPPPSEESPAPPAETSVPAETTTTEVTPETVEATTQETTAPTEETGSLPSEETETAEASSSTAFIPPAPEGEIEDRPSLLAAVISAISFGQWLFIGLLLLSAFFAGPLAYRRLLAWLRQA